MTIDVLAVKFDRKARLPKRTAAVQMMKKLPGVDGVIHNSPPHTRIVYNIYVDQPAAHAAIASIASMPAVAEVTKVGRLEGFRAFSHVL